MNTTLKETLKTLVTNIKAFLSENYPTTNSLTGSATIATKNSNTVVIKSGISESDGVISNSAGVDITLADVASTGSYTDLSNKPAIKAGQGVNSIIEGDLVGNSSIGTRSHAEGYNTTASGAVSHAEGSGATASGQQSHAEGFGTLASGASSHAEGTSTTASGSESHAEGFGTSAGGQDSHAEGYYTTANHKSQHVFGECNIADPSLTGPNSRGNYIEIVGNGANDNARSNARTLDWSGNETLAGNLTIGGTITANGQQILPQKQADWNQTASAESDYIKNKPVIKAGQGENSIIEGDIDNNVAGDFSHAEGNGTTASGNYSHTEGGGTTASGDGSHAEGAGATASGSQSHAEGGGTTASGDGSHAEGSETIASGNYSHTEGAGTTASGWASHAEGWSSTASGDGSHAEGYQTKSNHKCQHVFGEYNGVDPSTASSSIRGTYVEIVGNGTDDTARSNARTLDWDGNETLAGNLTIGGTITANGQQILPQKQADWNQTASTGSDYIKNKPTKLSDFINDGEGGSPSDPFTTTGEVNAAFKKLYPQISTSTELSAATFNSIGVLTESITFTLPTIAVGTAPEFNGQFTVDSEATYSVAFPAGIVMQGDTTIEAGGTYQFSICNGYGVIIKVD